MQHFDCLSTSSKLQKEPLKYHLSTCFCFVFFFSCLVSFTFPSDFHCFNNSKAVEMRHRDDVELCLIAAILSIQKLQIFSKTNEPFHFIQGTEKLSSQIVSEYTSHCSYIQFTSSLFSSVYLEPETSFTVLKFNAKIRGSTFKYSTLTIISSSFLTSFS